jgi:hypothetical protein
MRIRRLARDAVFITVAVMVLGGFSTGIAGATSAAPTSSAVTSSSAIHRMLPSCNTPAVCTFDVSIRGIILLQRFPCTVRKAYSNITNPIFQILNACPTRVWYFNPGSSAGHCLNPNSNQSGFGRFGTVRGIGVSANRSNC